MPASQQTAGGCLRSMLVERIVMRVLVSSMPGRGHVYPIVPLVQSLKEAGHEVLWATGPDAVAWLEASGIAAAPVGVEADGAVIPGFAHAL